MDNRELQVYVSLELGQHLIWGSERPHRFY
jgi:hypothetical protein